jgi:PAS domain S-box-containing protein
MAREGQLRVLLDTIPTLVWQTSADGSAEFLNRRWLEYTGLSADEARGWSWSAALHPDDRDSLIQTWQAILRSGQPGEAEARLRRADGQYRWFLFRCEPLHDETGKLTGWCGTNTDIEDRKRVEDDVSRSKEILDEIQRLTRCGSMGLNFATGEVFWSAEGARIFGFDSQDRPTVEQIWERLHPEDRWLSERSVERVRRGEPDTEYEVRLVMPDGSIRYVRRIIDPPGGSVSPVGSVCAVIDVTETREAEAALHQAQAELAHVTRLTSLGELAASVANEILQPISAIATAGEALSVVTRIGVRSRRTGNSLEGLKERKGKLATLIGHVVMRPGSKRGQVDAELLGEMTGQRLRARDLNLQSTAARIIAPGSSLANRAT